MAFRRIQTIHERIQSGCSSRLLLRRYTRVIDDSVRLATTDNFTAGTREYCITRLEAIERSTQRAAGPILSEQDALNLLTSLRAILEEFRIGANATHAQSGFQVERTESTRGAPRYAISQQQIEFLVQCGFTISRMSDLLGVSEKTIQRRMREYGVWLRKEYSTMTDAELDQIVHQCLGGNQRLGPNSVRARLFSQGISVQRYRIRESMLRMDPGGFAIRAAPTTQRRTYTVAGPNSLWHIDGNHKLIRWKIVIHGGIDGYSRMLVFLKASDNNRKATVLQHFMVATSIYGMPSRVRVDNGGENNHVCEIMEVLRGADRGSAIRGSSVHNQRIERAWVDLWNGATNLYYDLFHFLEHEGYLDTDNAVHIWALHFVFLPRLNREIDLFRDQWNNHGLRTENHQTPMQLFVGRSLELANCNLTAFATDFASSEEQDTVGELGLQEIEQSLDWDETAEDGSIRVAEVTCPLSADALERLQQTIQPLADSNELGIDIYRCVLNFITENT